MSTAHARLHRSCIFLAVSFRAIRDGLPCPTASPDTPCWLDAHLLEMLTRELRRCRDDAASPPAARHALDLALTHATLLLAQCPAALDAARGRRQLEAVVAPLQDAAACLAGGPESRWQAATRRLGGWLRR